MAELGLVMEEGKNWKSMIYFAVKESCSYGYESPSSSTMSAFRWLLQHVVKGQHNKYFLYIFNVRRPFGSFTYDRVRYITEEQYKEKGLQFMKYFEGICKLHKISCITAILPSNLEPKVVIVDQVLKSNPNLLLLGRRHLPNLPNFAEESVSKYCQEHCSCAVLAVPRRNQPEDDPAAD